MYNKMVRNSDFSRYLVTGVFNTALDICIYLSLVELFGLYPVIANVISTVIVLSISFFLNYYFVFRSNKSKGKTVPFFVGVTLFNGWFIQSLVIWLVISVFTPFITEHWLNAFAKLCGVGVGMVCNFLEYRIIFRERKTREDV